MKGRHLAWLMWGDEPLGGVRRALGNFAAGMAARGWRISIVCLDQGELAQALRSEGYEVICLHAQGDLHRRYGELVGRRYGRLRGLLRLQGYRRALRTALAQLRPDALSLYWPDFLFLAGPCAKTLGIALVWELPEVPSLQRFRLNQRIYGALLRLWRVRPIANSQFTAARLGPVPGLSVVYPPSDAARFDPARVQAWRRADHGLPADSLLLGSIARLSPQKCGEALIAGFAAVAAEAPQLHLLFVGGPLDSPYAETLRTQVRQLGLEARVHFLGEVADPAPAHALLDLFISCRPDPEGFGLSIVEAMLSGKPVLARALGGPAETVVDGETGWHVEDASAGAIATALRRALAARADWPRLGAQGRARALDHYCLEQSIPRYERCLLEHLQARGGRP
ncbi:MAG: glycosyltransferase family 4 protein [Stagnimonas sp.]|nr:glycosyltransferase family 4 protein [Stagnimonas sp.]